MNSGEFTLKTLTEENFEDFASITATEGGGGCYCSFWHQKWGTYKDWQVQCKTDPERNKSTVREKVRAGFHAGAVVYENEKPIGWISVGPLTDFYWTQKRLMALGMEGAKIAGIVCITADKNYRGTGFQERVLNALKPYARSQNWSAIEGYPFDVSAIEKHGDAVFWPGFAKSYQKAGFRREGPHWLNSPEAERSIYRHEVS